MHIAKCNLSQQILLIVLINWCFLLEFLIVHMGFAEILFQKCNLSQIKEYIWKDSDVFLQHIEYFFRFMDLSISN